MATFAELKDRVSKRLMDESNTAVSTADVASAINNAIKTWAKKSFWFNEAHGTLTLATGATYITGLPTYFDYERPDNGFVISYAGSFYPLTKVKPEEFDLANAGGSGMPSIYTYRNGIYEIYPYPDQSYTATVNYVKKYANLASASDTNDFTNEAEMLIVYDASARLNAELRQDLDMAGYYQNAAAFEYTQLLERTRRQAGTGSLVVDGI